MHRPRPAFRTTLTVAVLLGCLLAGCNGPPGAGPEPFERVTFLTVPSFDGHQVPVTLYRPAGATAEDPVPVVLHSHGWGGSRETRLDAFRDFTDAGFAVAAIDMRGHGEARGTSQARVASPAYELRDVFAVISHLANLSWIRQESAGDPVVGAMGESYGGAYPLLAAAHDPRLDALVSRDTWNDLAAAMAPAGVPKTAWFASLWLAGSIQGRIHPEVRSGFEAAIQQGRIPDGAGGDPDLAALFRASSPSAYAGQVRVPSLFIQGVNDTLFDLGQAAANHAMVGATGAQTGLYTHLGGHTLSTGPRPREGRHPCGDPDDLALAWFKAHLQGGPAFSPMVCMALDDGTTVREDAYPLPGSPLAFAAWDLSVQPGNLTSRAAVDVDMEAPATIVGRATLSGNAESGAENATVFWSLEAVDPQGRTRTANGQVQPQRLAAGSFRIELAPVALHLKEGETLRLAVAAYSDLFAAPVATAGPVQFTGLLLELPIS